MAEGEVAALVSVGEMDEVEAGDKAVVEVSTRAPVTFLRRSKSSPGPMSRWY